MSLTQLDAQLTTWINGLAVRFPFLDGPMILVTKVGVQLMVFVVALRWWIGGRSRSERHVTIACGLSFILGLALNQLILLVVHRIRPYDSGVTLLLIAPSADPSFPSDHSTAAFAIVFGYLLHSRLPLALCFSIGAFLVAFSRVYLGTHYCGDVLGGMLTAFMAAAIVRGFYREGTDIDKWVTGIL